MTDFNVALDRLCTRTAERIRLSISQLPGFTETVYTPAFFNNFESFIRERMYIEMSRSRRITDEEAQIAVRRVLDMLEQELPQGTVPRHLARIQDS